MTQSSDVLNLSSFYEKTGPRSRHFLERYLKLTHCDLFFADAAVLVEGNVERLLLPQMIASSAPRLRSAYLSILEIGGAFGHRFKGLVEYLGITTLIITDIDSVLPGAELEIEAEDDDVEEVVSGLGEDQQVAGAEVAVVAVAVVEDEEEPDDDDDEAGPGTACMTSEIGAVTSNQTLIKWLPGKRLISELLAAEEQACIQARTPPHGALVRVSYQSAVEATWGAEKAVFVVRTLEEAFALENLVWSQDKARKDLKLRVRGAAKLSLAEVAARIHRKVAGSSFRKTDFALALLEQDPKQWKVPMYIADGLQWLEREVTPPEAGSDGDGDGNVGKLDGFEDLLG